MQSAARARKMRVNYQLKDHPTSHWSGVTKLRRLWLFGRSSCSDEIVLLGRSLSLELEMAASQMPKMPRPAALSKILLAAALLSSLAAAAPTKKPNFLVLFVDDM